MVGKAIVAALIWLILLELVIWAGLMWRDRRG